MKKILGFILGIIAVFASVTAVFGRVYGGTVLYQITFPLNIKYFLPLILGVIAFIAVYKIWKDYMSAIVVGAVVFVLIFFVSCFSTLKVMAAYKTGNYIEVSGPVVSFKTSEKDESFEIEGVKFEGYVGSSVGYNLSQADGGVVKGDNQLLYIQYVEFMGRNVICYIESVL